VGKDIGELKEKKHKPFVAAFVSLLCGVGAAFAWGVRRGGARGVSGCSVIPLSVSHLSFIDVSSLLMTRIATLAQ
jgi:hypothetical protein